MATRNLLTRTPTISMLYKHLVQRVPHKWEELCIFLEVVDKDGAVLETIRRDFFHLGSEMCLFQVLTLWLKGGGKLPVNWQTIITCLEDMELNAVARDLQQVLQQPDPPSQPDPPTAGMISRASTAPPVVPLTLLDSDLPLSAAKYHLKPSVESELRDYQWELALPGLSGQNYIICAPTGSGKTRVAGLIISEHLQGLGGRGRVLFIVNKVPLVQQQRRALQDMIEGVKIEEVTGDTSQNMKAVLSASLKANSSSEDENEDQKRFELDNDIIVCTAGCLVNELEQGGVSLAAVSLMVIDECHNTRKNSDYASIMERYIRLKTSAESAELPQVVGLTATPGAGESSRPTLFNVIDHMIALCAGMDATGGIHTVRKNVLDLKKHQTSAEHTKVVQEGRSKDKMITLIVTIMEKLEQLYKLKAPSDDKWRPKYHGWINSLISELQCRAQGDHRDKMSVLKTLKCLASVLLVYQNLTYADALEELSRLAIPSGQKATPTERNLSIIISRLKIKLDSLDIVENPLLLQLEEILHQNFSNTPNSRAIIFVETKNEATSIHRWICSRPKLCSIQPDVITGQTRDTGKKMTKAEQDLSLEGFRQGSCNLLVSTSVLEEGVDVPACNLVIRYQKVSSEIAQVQSSGRARASHSQSFTIVNSKSGKQFQEMLNEEKNCLVEQALEMFPTGEYLCNGIKTKQVALLKQKDMQIVAAGQRHIYSPMEVDVCCIHCSAFLCNGSDIHTIPTTTHHVVTGEDVLSHLEIKPHPRPADVPNGLSRTHKLQCVQCGLQALGVMGKWWRNNVSYPVIKCEYVKFRIGKELVACKKWKKVPFEVSPL